MTRPCSDGAAARAALPASRGVIPTGRRCRAGCRAPLRARSTAQCFVPRPRYSTRRRSSPPCGGRDCGHGIWRSLARRPPAGYDQQPQLVPDDCRDRARARWRLRDRRLTCRTFEGTLAHVERDPRWAAHVATHYTHLGSPYPCAKTVTSRPAGPKCAPQSVPITPAPMMSISSGSVPRTRDAIADAYFRADSVGAPSRRPQTRGLPNCEHPASYSGSCGFTGDGIRAPPTARLSPRPAARGVRSGRLRRSRPGGSSPGLRWR